MNFTFDNRQDSLFVLREGFSFPSFTSSTQYSSTSHSDFRRRIRSTLQPYEFDVPLIVLTDEGRVSRDKIIERLNNLLYSTGPNKFKIEDTNWYFIGEFNGPYFLPPYFNKFSQVDVQFSSQYPYKFYDDEKVQTAAKTVTISTKSQLPTIPLIELTGLTGTDVQISISGDSFRRIRLTGDIPGQLTIDIENERIYETNSGLNRINLLRYDSAFEDFRIKNQDVVVLTNASETAKAKLTYKELLL